MSSTTELTELHELIGNLRRCVTSLASRYGDSPATRRIVNDAERILRQVLRKEPRHPAALNVSAIVLTAQKKYVEAEAPLREGLDVRLKLEPLVWTTFNAKALLGAALLGQKKYADAEPLLLDGYQGLKASAAQIPASAKFRLIEAVERLVKLYDAWDRPEQATQWRKKLDETKGTKRTPKQLP